MDNSKKIIKNKIKKQTKNKFKFMKLIKKKKNSVKRTIQNTHVKQINNQKTIVQIKDKVRIKKKN